MQSANEICSSPAFDAIVTTGDGESYVFKAARYWKLTADSVAPGYPRNIAGDWGGLPVVLQKVTSEANPKVRNHGEGPY